jgi:hypothetical protein
MTGQKCHPYIAFQRGSSASSGMPLAVRVRPTALLHSWRGLSNTHRALVSWPGTARSTVPRVMIISAHSGGLEAGTRRAEDAVQVFVVWAGLAISGVVVVCAEPSVITVVAAMPIEQFSRDLTCRASQECDIYVSRQSGMK